MEGTDTPPLSPFALRLICHENTLVCLTTLVAYISTIGGGFYHCQHLSTAIVLVRRHPLGALLRGDIDMVWRYQINEGFCYIHGGRPNRGKGVIRRMLGDVMVRSRFTTFKVPSKLGFGR